ncbi:hypothetical protein G6F32_015442 [Rhizopus arrhizus]|nr:hypothetical protein G6F32_015442 [Rhizopus arrhizus]
MRQARPRDGKVAVTTRVGRSRRGKLSWRHRCSTGRGFDHADSTSVARLRAHQRHMVSADRLIVAGMRFGELGFARIQRIGSGYALTYAG